MRAACSWPTLPTFVGGRSTECAGSRRCCTLCRALLVLSSSWHCGGGSLVRCGGGPLVGPRCSPPTTTDNTDAADPKSMQQLLVWRRSKEAELAAKRKKAKREEEEEDVEKAKLTRTKAQVAQLARWSRWQSRNCCGWPSRPVSHRL